MIQDNTVNILGWIQYEKVKWLQNNNPEVPGLIYKLAPMNEKMRKLSNVRKLWEGILEIQRKNFIIFWRRICCRCMSLRDGRGMKFGSVE